MRVICIKEDSWKYFDPEEIDTFGPVYNEKCTVIDIEVEDGISYYVLAEYYKHPTTGNYESYECKWFIPLSEIDETEMVREHKVLINP